MSIPQPSEAHNLKNTIGSLAKLPLRGITALWNLFESIVTWDLRQMEKNRERRHYSDWNEAQQRINRCNQQGKDFQLRKTDQESLYGETFI